MAKPRQPILCPNNRPFCFTDFDHEYHAFESVLQLQALSSDAGGWRVATRDTGPNRPIILLRTVATEKADQADILDTPEDTKNHPKILR